jgi:hypothetical protein
MPKLRKSNGRSRGRRISPNVGCRETKETLRVGDVRAPSQLESPGAYFKSMVTFSRAPVNLNGISTE